MPEPTYTDFESFRAKARSGTKTVDARFHSSVFLGDEEIAALPARIDFAFFLSLAPANCSPPHPTDCAAGM